VSAFLERYGTWAVVAGASSGLGEEFARQLAARGLSLLLIARSGDKLKALAAELAQKHSIEARALALDLAAPDLAARVEEATAGLDVGLLVYNAALSLIGPFLSQPIADKLHLVDVNCRGPLILSDQLGRRLAARGRGGIVLMTSLAASRGSPLVATYAATKAFDLVLAEGLWDELGAHGVDVLACRAGAIRTPAYESTAPASTMAPVMESASVVRRALDSLGRKPSVIPGFMNSFGDFLLGRLMPRRAAIRVMGRTTRAMYPRLAAPKGQP
jgi:short-subunit dehydrogenase